MRRARASLLVILLAACEAAEPLAPESVAAPYLAGEDKLCLSDADCRGTVCSFGVCAGLVSADRPWMTDAITDALAARVAAGDVSLSDLRGVFARELDGDRYPDLRRARLLRGWARLDREGAAEAARRLFQAAATAPILLFEAARVLLREHDAAAEAWLVDRVRTKGLGVVPFLAAEWRFFAPPARATILGFIAGRGDAALRDRLRTLERQVP